MKKSIVRATAILVFGCLAAFGGLVVLRHTEFGLHLRGKKSVQDTLQEYGPNARSELAPLLKREALEFPPKRLALVCLKQERRIELWCANENKVYKHIKDYPVLGMSGKQGPKLARNDMQVPEGIYRIESLNPNSIFHLAIRLDYPNEFDRGKGRQDNRRDLGSDIMIHGGSSSIGCLAMGDRAIEELYTLAAETGTHNVVVVIAPGDMRKASVPPPVDAPAWTSELYSAIRAELKSFS